MTANYLANFLSGLSLFFGFVSIIFSLEAHFTFSAWAIIFSVVFDGLDGQFARKSPAPNEFGKELDSLVDVVSFGIAPSILGYTFVYQDFHLWATVSLFLYLVAGVSRLARYNVEYKQVPDNYFCGLPTTAAGGMLASFILVYRGWERFPSHLLFLCIVLMLAFLMISRIKYLNLDGLKQALGKYIIPISILTLAGMLFFAEITLLAFFLLYLISPLFSKKIV